MNAKLTDAQIDRAMGAWMGLFVGDALGTTLEFSRRDSLPHQSEVIGGGPFGLEPGDYTDDGAMALGMAEALLSHGQSGKFPALRVMTEWELWYHGGKHSSNGRCFDVGNSTRTALSRFMRDDFPLDQCADRDAAGNGCIMRLAPVVLWNVGRGGSKARSFDLAVEQCRLTHGHCDAVQVSGQMGRLLHDFVKRGGSSDSSASRSQEGIEWRARDQVSSRGLAVDTYEAALWSLHCGKTFEDAVTLAVNLGDDADTVGAVTGQLAGAAFGLSHVPERWLSKLKRREYLESVGRRLLGVM